ncbi:MAG: hypothetical protein OEW12_00365 [Deltaproteobacteria bacterium]|nr:hypothetical protein [Deltaproteobacteria bacterium]
MMNRYIPPLFWGFIFLGYALPVVYAEPPAKIPAGTDMAFSQDQSSASVKIGFSTLSFLDRDGWVVAYNSKGSKVVDKKLTALDKNHPLRVFLSPDDDASAVLLLETLLNTSDKSPSYLLFDPSECCPEFHFYTTSGSLKHLGGLEGTALSVPGNGSVFVATRLNSTYTHRRKYRVSATGLAEVRQPYYSVGFKTKVLKPVTLYSAQDGKEEVARLPEGADIEVVLFDPAKPMDSLNYLVKTPFGLLGWIAIPTIGPQSDPSTLTIEGMNHWGE